MDVDKVVAARVGRKKPPLKVLWARYLTSGQDVPGHGSTGMTGSVRSSPSMCARMT